MRQLLLVIPDAVHVYQRVAHIKKWWVNATSPFDQTSYPLTFRMKSGSRITSSSEE